MNTLNTLISAAPSATDACVVALDFNDRASYLAWAQAWKSDYRAHSAQIRALKVQFRQAQRDGAPRLVESLRRDVQRASSRATVMIAERHESKQQAQRQYLACAAETAAKNVLA